MTEDCAIQRAREALGHITEWERYVATRKLHNAPGADYGCPCPCLACRSYRDVLAVAAALRTLARECVAIADPPMGDAASQFNRGRLDAALAIREKFSVEEK